MPPPFWLCYSSLHPTEKENAVFWSQAQAISKDWMIRFACRQDSSTSCNRACHAIFLVQLSWKTEKCVGCLWTQWAQPESSGLSLQSPLCIWFKTTPLSTLLFLHDSHKHTTPRFPLIGVIDPRRGKQFREYINFTASSGDKGHD